VLLLIIKMIGIDFNKASLKERELFAFSASQLEHSLKNIYNKNHINGCVIISTCNRTELWISAKKESDYNLIDIICNEKGVFKSQFEKLFIAREDNNAILHLFETACGMRSQILGEDQILSQVKSSIDIARENNVADELLEKLFQMAITSAKKVKSTVHITTADTSVAHAALAKAKQYYKDLSGVKCLIIGNGEMGRLAAELFLKNGCDVSITLRNHKNGKNIVPNACKTIDYNRRTEKIHEFDIILSATISPHHTIKKEDIKEINKMLLFIDLAVPRDIDEGIREYKNAILVDMDNIGIHLSVDKTTLQMVNKIIGEHKADFHKWCITRKYLKSINKITFEKVVDDLKKDIDNLNLNLSEKGSLKNKIISILQNAI